MVIKCKLIARERKLLRKLSKQVSLNLNNQQQAGIRQQHDLILRIH